MDLSHRAPSCAQVPRAFHHGAKGSFMSPRLHDASFAHIAYSVDEHVRWPTSRWAALRRSLRADAYEARMRAMLQRAEPLSDLRPLANASARQPARLLSGDGREAPSWPAGPARDRVLALWYTQPPRTASSKLFSELANFLGIWHEMRRASHFGVHELWCGSAYVLLVNTVHGPQAKPSPYLDLAPPRDRVYRTSEALRDAVKRALRPYPRRSQVGICRDLSRPRKACRQRACV